MARFESLRDRLPSLYRPEADGTATSVLSLRREELAELAGAYGPLRFTATTHDGALVVERRNEKPVRALRLAPGRAPGPGYALELRTVEEGGALSLSPFAVLPLHDGVAVVGATQLPTTFAVQLKQRTLLTLQLLAVADVLERLNREAGEVMQSHWFAYADRAVYNPFFLRSRALQKLPLPALTESPVRRFPYIDDLGRLASLLLLPPWQEPIVQDDGAATPETVETYRQRIARIVALYANGLGTREALRRMTEAQLPVDVDAIPERRDRPFSVEEFAPLAAATVPVRIPGQPNDRVGPLMHWPLTNGGVTPVAATVFVQAPTAAELEETAPDGELRYAAAVAPLLELYVGGPLRIGLAYRDTVPDAKTLRIRPVFASWIGSDAGVATAASEPGDMDADPTAPGPWAEAAGAPAGPISALLRTEENVLWAAVATGELWRYDGAAWTQALSGLGTIHCLAEDDHDLLVGTDGGLVRMFRFPDDGFTAQPEPDPDDRSVRALLRTSDGVWWAGTSAGLGTLGPGDEFVPTPFTLDVWSLGADSTGALYVGGVLGLAAHRPDTGEWWWYDGESASDEVSEWGAFDPSFSFPTDADVFLPPVTAVLRSRDGTLWIGTTDGLARYLARGDGGPVAYRTLLEAFPDLGTGRVDTLAEDERGLLWVGTSRGLLRYDGRDWFQFQNDAWMQLGRAASLYPDGGEAVPRGTWRFRRSGGSWERFDTALASPAWIASSGDPRTTDEQRVRALAFTDGLVADIVDSWDAATFAVTGSSPVEASRFVTRVKLDGDRRVVDGGIAALPRVPVGKSTWRYLSLEPAEAMLPPSRPAWTIEGRLLPPTEETPTPEPEPGRYYQGLADPLDDESEYDDALFAFPPAARVVFSWSPKHPLSVLVRLGARKENDTIDPAALDRVFDGMRQVRPAGVRAVLAVGEKTVRKES